MSHLSTYVGIFLDQNSKGLLNKLRTFVPKDWVWYGDHMTIKFFGAPTYPEDFPEPYSELATSGKAVKLVVSHIGISDNAIAVKVDGYPLESQTAHITLATPMGGSPSQSKNITSWKKIKPFTLHGTIMGNGDAGERVMAEEDLTSDTLVPFKGERRAELDGKDYLETVWAAPTMHVKYGGTMTESIVKKLVARRLHEISFNDIKHLLRDLHLLWVTPDGKVIEADAHEELLNQLYPEEGDTYDKYYKAFREGYVRVKYGQYATGSSVKIDFSVEGTNRNNIKNAVNAYLPYISTQETIVTIEDPTDNYYTFTLPKHRWQLEEFLETGKYDRRNMSEALITKLVLKELTTTFPFNVGSVENTYQSWTDTAGDANKPEDMNEIEHTDITTLPFVAAIEKAGGKVYQVGGAVRDSFLGKTSKDLDIMVSGLTAEQLTRILTPYGRANMVGESFAVIKFKPHGSQEDIDIALARTDKKVGAGHRGIEVFADPSISVETDLERRDFTINAIAKDIHGNIIDPFGGVKDLQNRVIRMVSPTAFAEDPLRMLRAIQFAARFDFTIDPATFNIIKQNANDIRTITAERVLEEFNKMFQKGHPDVAAKLLVDSGLYQGIFGTEFKGSYEKFPQVKRMSEFIYLLTKDSLPSPATFYKNNLKGDINTFKELKVFELPPPNDEASERWLLNKAHSIFPDAIGSFVTQDKLKDVSKHPEEKYPRIASKIAVSSDEILALGIKGEPYGQLNRDLLDLIYKDQLPNEHDAIMNYIRQNLDKYKTNTPKKIQEITVRLLKEYYGQGVIDKLENALFKYYQEAYDVRSAAYITPSGRLLSMVPRDGRSRDDHRSIGSIMQDLNIDLGQYNTPKWEHSETKWMYLAMDLGFIRTMPESHNEADLDMRTAPTGDQMARIEELVSAHNGRTVLDLRNGDREASIMYDWETPTEWVMEEIRRFYYFGEDPRPWRGYDALDDENLMEKKKPSMKRDITESVVKKLAKEALTLYHGSPRKFDQFSTSYMGQGEGAQSFGWGLYFTELEDIARHYANKLSKNQDSTWFYTAPKDIQDKLKNGQVSQEEWEEIKANEIKRITNIIGMPDKLKAMGFPDHAKHFSYGDFGIEYWKQALNSIKSMSKPSDAIQTKNLYQVTVHKDKSPDQYDWMIWDQQVPEHQINKIYNFISKSHESDYENDDAYYQIRQYLRVMSDPNFTPQKKTGKQIYHELEQYLGSKGASMMLLHAGIDGIKYPAESITHGATSDNARGYNYVVFDDKAVTVDKAEALQEKLKPTIIRKLTKQKLQEIAMKSRQNQLKRLVVFDMDSTLVSSPMPDFGREEWKEKTGEEFPSKRAWWSMPQSLDTDVFDIKAIAPVFNQMRDEQRRSDTMVVVMTNRLDTLEKEVRRVMKLNRINPDQLSMAEYAMQNKGERILQILQDNPSIRYVAFYDDQEKNIMDVRTALKKRGITYDLYNCQDGKIRRT